MFMIGCGGRINVGEFKLIVDNEAGLFQSNTKEMTQAISGSVGHKMENRRMKSILNMEGESNIVILKMISDKVKFNPSWFWGDGYTRTVQYELAINGVVEPVQVSVETSKDGAIDRFVGHVSGLGSHPGYRAFPGTLGKNINEISEDLLKRIE